MRGLLLMFLLIGCDCCCLADEPALQAKPQIRPPFIPVLKDPRPPAVPLDELTDLTVVPDLLWGHLMVYEADMQLIILHSPDGAIAVKEHKIASGNEFIAYGQFCDGVDGDDGDKVLETRSYKGPWVYVITGTKAAKVELIVVPVGVANESEILRQKLAVSGKGPRPPPPEPDDDDADPPKPDKVERVSIAIVEDVGNRTPDSAILINALLGWKEFGEAGHAYRVYDKSTGEANGKAAISVLGNQQLPAIVITDFVTGKVLHKGPLPKDIAVLKALVGSLTK